MYYIDLNEFSKKELLSIYNSLNHYTWDNRLGDKPVFWDNCKNYDKENKLNSKYHRIKPLLEEFEWKLSKRERLKCHHLNVLGNSRLKFEWYWWIERRLSGIPWNYIERL